MPRIEDVCRFVVDALVCQQDRHPCVPSLAILASVLWFAEEHEVVDPVAQLGGEAQEVDRATVDAGRVVDAQVEGLLLFQREVVDRDGERFGEAFGPCWLSAGNGVYHFYDYMRVDMRGMECVGRYVGG